MPWIRKDGKRVWSDPAEADRDPLLACEVTKQVPTSNGGFIAHVSVWMAFDCSYGPETQEQIDWHIANGTPGAETWEVGRPVKGYGSSTR